MSDDRAIIWTFIGTLIGFKFVTSALVFFYFPSWYTAIVLAVVNIFWFAPLFYYAPRYLRGRYRLWSVRVKRRKLIEQEWNVHSHSSTHIDRG